MLTTFMTKYVGHRDCLPPLYLLSFFCHPLPLPLLPLYLATFNQKDYYKNWSLKPSCYSNIVLVKTSFPNSQTPGHVGSGYQQS